MVDPLPIGATIGILGGGQLGRMLAVAASRLGLKSVVFDPSADSPAAQVANAHIKGNWDDLAALARFAAQVDVVTYEFENIPTATLDALESSKSVFPSYVSSGFSPAGIDNGYLWERWIKTFPPILLVG